MLHSILMHLDQFLQLKLSNVMFFNKRKTCVNCATGEITDFPESLVNPLYKPKTLAEMKAEMIHTGVNPAPASLRTPLPVSDGVDPMDAPPLPITGDTFEHIRMGEHIKRNISSEESKLEHAKESQGPPVVTPDPPADPAK